jgi:PPOX class probable F420-dependent enzyme
LPHPALAERFEREPIVWLSSSHPDGRPHLVPVWFVWDGEAFLVFSKPTARKVRNMAEAPNVTLAIGSAERDFDVQLVEGHAVLLEQQTAAVVPSAMWTKYAEPMASAGLSRDEFVATYRQAIRIIPTRFLPWRGRTLGPAF